MLSNLRFLVSHSQFKVSVLVSLTLLSIYPTLSLLGSTTFRRTRPRTPDRYDLTMTLRG